MNIHCSSKDTKQIKGFHKTALLIYSELVESRGSLA